jgi:phosphate-selective porin OprO/OprP
MRWLLLLSFFCVAPVTWGQLLRDPPQPEQPPPEQPLIYRDAGGQAEPPESVHDAVDQLRRDLRAVAESAVSTAEKEERMRQLLEERVERARAASEANGTLQLDRAIDMLQRTFVEEVLEVAPDDETREQILEGAPRHLELERRRPYLIAPEEQRVNIVLTDDPEQGEALPPWWRYARFDTEALDLEEVPESPEEQLEPPEENLEAAEVEEQAAEGAVEVAVLADENVTVEMHDDNTILRNVETVEGDLALLEGINVWFGGALQYDAVSLEDLYVANQGGGSETDTFTRRAEVTVRATLFDLGEFKLQYDIDGDFWRDLYFRHADEQREYTLTIGNQTEPMSQENILGNKFNMAMEVAAPTSVFAPNRGMGVKLNKWWETGTAPSLLSLSNDSDEAVTAAIGIFREDIEDTSDTDWSVTGRTTAGRLYGDWGVHVGLSGSYRDGDFRSVNPRPELSGTDRVVLARFDADTLKIAAFELLASRGSWHGTAEFYYADFDGGEIDATGYGGFIEAGYYLTGQSRRYRPRWGLWAPLKVGARNIFEVFGRFSYTRGDADDDPSNDLRIVTLGGSWYRHKIRVSANLLYSKTDRPIVDQDDGFGAGLRFQYLF